MRYRGANGQRPRKFMLGDAKTLEPRVLSMGELTEAEFPPQYSLYFSESDWRGGIGGEFHKSTPLQLATSVKIDASVLGKLQLAREVKSTTVGSNPDNYKPSGFAIVGTEVWAFIGRDVYIWNYGTTSWDIMTEPQAANVTYRNGVEFKGKTYAACWDSSDVPTRYIYKADADAQWTLIAASAGNYPKYIAKGKNVDGDDLLFGGNFGSGAVNNLRTSSADPTVGASWATAIAIGDSSSEITGLLSDGQTVLILKTDGIWAYYADGTQQNLTPDFASMAHPDNFRGAYMWNGHALLPLGAGGLMELSEGKLYDISLKLRVPNDTTLHGRVVAITGDPQSLFILVQDTTNLKYHLLMAKWLELDGTYKYRWHHLGSIAYTTDTVEEHITLFAEGVPSGANIHHRVWIGVESTGSSLLPYFYPLDTDAEDGFTNDTDVIAQFQKFDANLPKVNKSFASVDIESANLGAGGRLFTVEYRVDNGSWLTDLTFTGGTVGGNTCDLSPNQTATFPNGTTGKILEIRVKPALTSVGTTSPELLHIRVTAQLRPSTLKVLPLSLHLADGQRLLNGTIATRGPVADLSQLETWDAQAAEVIVADDRSTTRNMVFLPGLMKVEEIHHEAYRRPEYIVGVVLAEV